MTEREKEQPEELSDQQVEDIARTAGIEIGNLHIFINGYLLAKKKIKEIT
jgi:signal recognition particle GTPase